MATRKARRWASILNNEQLARPAEIVEALPIPTAHGLVRWRSCDLAYWFWDEFELSVTCHTLGRDLRAMGYRKLTAQPRNRGQRTKLTWCSVKRGTQPSAPKDQRRSPAWLLGAICPAEGKAAGIVMFRCNSETMSMHLEEIALQVSVSAHAVLLFYRPDGTDRRNWSCRPTSRLCRCRLD